MNKAICVNDIFDDQYMTWIILKVRLNVFEVGKTRGVVS